MVTKVGLKCDNLLGLLLGKNPLRQMVGRFGAMNGRDHVIYKVAIVFSGFPVWLI